MCAFFRSMLRSAWILLAGLLVIGYPVGAENFPGRDSGEIWHTTDPPDWQSGASLTDPYPPEDPPQAPDTPREQAGAPQDGKRIPPAVVSGPGGTTGTTDPVIQRLNEAYEDTAGAGGQGNNRDTVAPSIGIALLRAMFALALVLGLFFLFIRVLKWVRSFTPSGTAASGTPARIAVTDRVPLGSRHAVYLLKVRDQIIVAGTAPGTIVPLAVFSAEEAGQQASAEKSETEETHGSSESLNQGGAVRFRGLLLKTLERMEAQAAEAATEPAADSEGATGDPVDRDIDALREDIERLRRFLEESGHDRGGG